MRLHQVDQDAGQPAGPQAVELADITRVEFGGRYENALHVVAGHPEATLRPP